MTKIKHLDQKDLDEVILKLWEIEGSLRGVGGLMQQQTGEPFYEAKDLFGLGQFLRKIADDLADLQENLSSLSK